MICAAQRQSAQSIVLYKGMLLYKTKTGYILLPGFNLPMTFVYGFSITKSRTKLPPAVPLPLPSMATASTDLATVSPSPRIRN